MTADCGPVVGIGSGSAVGSGSEWGQTRECFCDGWGWHWCRDPGRSEV